MKTQLASRSSLLVALAAAVLAGCGGHGEQGSATSAPRIRTQPQSTTAALGESATFSVSARNSGSGGLTYQWLRNGFAVPGATSSTFTIDSVQNSDLGVYTVQVSNEASSVTSNAATLALPDTGAPRITTPPQSQSVAAGAQAVFTVVATGEGLSYQWYKDGAEIAGATSASYTIPTVGSGNVGTYTVRVTNENGAVTSSGATLSFVSSAAPVITSPPSSASPNLGASTTFRVTASGQGTLSYQWFKDGAAISGATGASYTISPVLLSSAGSYTVTVTNSLGSATSAPATLTVISPPVITSQPTSQRVNVNQTFTFSVTATGTGLTYQWYKDVPGTQADTAIPGATGPTYTGTATAGSAGSYYVQIKNARNVIVQSSIVALIVNGPPTITSQPANATVGVGGTATFTVTATTPNGTTATYQWFKNGTAISGATSASYTTPAATSGDNGATYYVEVANEAGTTRSGTVTLTVLQQPTITSQPQSLTVTVGQSASFTVVATSSLTPTYQWYKNGVAIAGATSATYTIASAATTDAGSYYVIVYNGGVPSAGTTSATATLTVNP